MVAGALSVRADVTVYASQGPEVRRFTDGVFSVVELGTDSDERTESERKLAGLEYLASRAQARSLIAGIGSEPGRLATLVGRDALEHWSRAESLVAEAQPDLVVLADYQQMGAARLAASLWPGTPVVVLPLVPSGASALVPSFAGTFKEARLALVFTEDERRVVEGVTDIPVARVALPIASNASVLRAPHEQVGERHYIAVVTGAPLHAPSSSASQAMLLVSRFPDHVIAVCATDALGVFGDGAARVSESVGRGTDLLRLMAWATATVDLRPGPVYARRCLQSLVHGTPVLVPAATRGREHAQLGRCGLWFDGPTEFLRATDALLTPPVSEVLGRQSAGYVAQWCRSSEGFVDDIFSSLRGAVDLF
jgi:hypothetical protein